MGRRLIAIVGSLEEGRPYDAPLTRLAEGAAVCEELGRELARNGCDIIVYSSLDGFIEGPVVRGYVGSGEAKPQSIHVRFPLGTAIEFPELQEHRPLFDIKADSSPDWEVSFYRSLASTQGVLLIGGGRSTFITGLIALAYRVPVLALTMFGGSARKVWEALDRDNGLADPGEVAAMADEWHPESASRLVGGLVAADERRIKREDEKRRRTADAKSRTAATGLLAAVLLTLACATIAVAWRWSPGSQGAFLALFIGPLLAGGAGSMVRAALDRSREWAPTIGLGLVAGLIAFLLFLVAQLAATPDVVDKASGRLLVFGVPTGFIAGLTFDVVFEKLRRTDVVDTSSVHANEGTGS